MWLLRRVSSQHANHLGDTLRLQRGRISRCSIAFSWRPSVTRIETEPDTFAGISMGTVEILSSPR